MHIFFQLRSLQFYISVSSTNIKLHTDMVLIFIFVKNSVFDFYKHHDV
jgi:hypothetical protein